ncbi:hypothetical protein RGE_06340 [Rubrivivax gelatinosus IL144]|uniref:Uncharacterized protein n=1 Tax=Rubrivivax gelatinosus (strain NBRC 100245 / IL144) TaxID=983917 RepID=I0HLU2_RUBGI|nr:hypothetical protein RGE_06340 [Rubrivivax gelatinosus IL144]
MGLRVHSKSSPVRRGRARYSSTTAVPLAETISMPLPRAQHLLVAVDADHGTGSAGAVRLAFIGDRTPPRLRRHVRGGRRDGTDTGDRQAPHRPVELPHARIAAGPDDPDLASAAIRRDVIREAVVNQRVGFGRLDDEVASGWTFGQRPGQFVAGLHGTQVAGRAGGQALREFALFATRLRRGRRLNLGACVRSRQ